MAGMTIEILLFDGFDDLDAFGPFEVLSEAGLPTRFVTILPTERVRSAHGAKIVPDGVLGDFKCRSSCAGSDSIFCGPPMFVSRRRSPSVTVHWKTPQFLPRWARNAASRTSSMTRVSSRLSMTTRGTRDASRVCNSPAGETSAATELIGRGL